GRAGGDRGRDRGAGGETRRRRVSPRCRDGRRRRPRPAATNRVRPRREARQPLWYLKGAEIRTLQGPERLGGRLSSYWRPGPLATPTTTTGSSLAAPMRAPTHSRQT